MLCENCGENEANVKYTEIINGVKKEMNFCEECSNKLGVNNFDVPINFTSFFGDFLNEEKLFPEFKKYEVLKCEKCNLTYDEFIKSGRFGCDNCYNTFQDKIDSVLKKLHGENIHVGKKIAKIKDKNESNIKKKVSIKTSKKENITLDSLKIELKKAIQEENYEKAVIIRDEIKKL